MFMDIAMLVENQVTGSGSQGGKGGKETSGAPKNGEERNSGGQMR
jgi:hypothetical protein